MTSLSTPRRAGDAGQRAVSWAPLAVILCGTFVYVLDFFVVNVALPSIQRGLSAGPAAIEWVVAGYGLTSAAFLVTGGRLGDQHGRRKLFCVGIATFTIASAMGGAAPDAGFLIAGRLDLRGAALLALALVAILLPLLDGREQGWPAWSWACLAAGPVLLGAFAVHLRAAAGRGGQPLLDPAIFAVLAFRAGVTCQLLFYCQQAAGYLLLALYLQDGRGLSPMASGGAFTVLAVGFIATSFRAPALTIRFGRRVVTVGALVSALGDILLVLAVLPVGVPVAALFPGLLLLGAGQGLCLTPLTTTVLAHADASRAGSVSGALATAQQVGNAVGVAVSGVIFYGLLGDGHGYGAAYRGSVLEMTALLVGVAALTFSIP